MSRTSAIQVAAIVEVDPTINAGSLEAFIETASSLVDEVCVPANYGSARLELIERWLAAHFYAIRDKQVTGEKAGPVSANYQYSLGLVLSVTHYGQQAMLLDTAGGLAALSKAAETGEVAQRGVVWVGIKE